MNKYSKLAESLRDIANRYWAMEDKLAVEMPQIFAQAKHGQLNNMSLDYILDKLRLIKANSVGKVTGVLGMLDLASKKGHSGLGKELQKLSIEKAKQEIKNIQREMDRLERIFAKADVTFYLDKGDKQ